ncbi:NAD(P)/FAD-dependent oxidoreductase [candidate division KSB1 bacterium]|nr:NAD(P)/FAD-dependent oxidoreductase [candidate division KSB1 bacterium]NIR71323.1 NAD(P)/FAD-dependent oxidoreductase [candidate division KSB1 bacterium]NIS24833.1 NAD(P)/FAD-dependent oxidoreductase [candidate division KSB1 bacterium]NIT71753.1 NAD(P)/FAD-dependent oxidoreductase [candidate division KSB1 bacterium]NIU25468.1 NAD(P)/FAD-dependent oxidoreductase [candidate division KSB1 bacterium]
MNFDLVIAGAGPAGLSAACAAAKTGVRVAVIEKSKEIGYPIHTSGGSWIDELRKLHVPEAFMHPIREGVFISPNRKVTFKYVEPPSCILDVRGLYQYLAELASAAGAEIFVNTTVLNPVFEEDRIAGLQARRLGHTLRVQAPLVIDATGCAGMIARRLGLSKGFRRLGVGAEYDLFAPHWPEDRVAFLFGSLYAPSGYGWVFPHGHQRVRLGVGVIHPDTSEDPQMLLEKILSKADIFNGALSKVSRIEYHRGIIPSETFLQRTVSDGVMVVGDAGGLVSTLLGEGIRFAIDIGRMAGGVAAEAISRKRFDEDFLRKFERVWKKKYKQVFKAGEYINHRIARYRDEQWDHRLETLSKLPPELLPVILKGEFTRKNVMKILRANPVFLRKAALSAFKSKIKFT